MSNRYQKKFQKKRIDESSPIDTCFIWFHGLVVAGRFAFTMTDEAILVLLGASKTEIRGMVGADHQQHQTCHETSVIKRMIPVTKENVQPPSAEASKIALVAFVSSAVRF